MNTIKQQMCQAWIKSGFSQLLLYYFGKCVRPGEETAGARLLPGLALRGWRGQWPQSQGHARLPQSSFFTFMLHKDHFIINRVTFTRGQKSDFIVILIRAEMQQRARIVQDVAV